MPEPILEMTPELRTLFEDADVSEQRDAAGLARRRGGRGTSRTTSSTRSRARSSSTSSTASRRPRRPTSRAGGTARPASAGAARPRSTAEPRLMCMTRMDELADGPRHGHADADVPDHPGPRHRRLVQLRDGQARPGVQPARAPEGGYRMQQVDIERGQEFRKCIECFLCQDVCHVIRDHEEQQAALRRARGSSSATPSSRCTPSTRTTAASSSASAMGLGLCNITKCCTEVCPEHIKITDNAIIPLKERVVGASYDPVAWLGRVVLRRKVRSADDAVRPARALVADAAAPHRRVDRGVQRGARVAGARHRRGRRARSSSPSSSPTRPRARTAR